MCSIFLAVKCHGHHFSNIFKGQLCMPIALHGSMDGSKIYINLITRIWIYKILIWSDFSRCLVVLAHGVISCKISQVLKEHLVCWPLVSVMLFAVCQRASICWHTSSVFHRSPTTWCALGSMDPFPCYEPRAWFLFFLESWKKHLFSIGFEWPEEMCTRRNFEGSLVQKETSTDILPGKIGLQQKQFAKLIRPSSK